MRAAASQHEPRGNGESALALSDFVALLRCPVSGSELELARLRADERLVTVPRQGQHASPVGVTDRLLRLGDGSAAYPVVDGIPVLLGPERLVPADSPAARDPVLDLRDPLYAEAWEERDHYNAVSRISLANLTRHGARGAQYMEGVATAVDVSAAARSFPEPATIWVHSGYEVQPTLEAYRHLAPVSERTFLQIGGSGMHAVKLLLAGARQGFLVTPMLEEARYALRLAQLFGVRERFAAVLGIGEQIPFRAAVFDLAISMSCFHHMRLEFVADELHRLLKPGGRFSGLDPYHTALHSVGTAVLGKRDPSVHCQPFTEARLAPLRQRFPHMTAGRHAPLLRYLCVGLEKILGGSLPFKDSVPAMLSLARADERLGRLLRLQGGVMVLTGTKAAHQPASGAGS